MRRGIAHRILLMCGVLLTAAGCLDGSYSGPFDPTTLAVDPIAVVIRFADKEESKATYEGKGALQDLTKLENDTMYVSIVRNDQKVSFRNSANFLLQNRPAIVNLQDSKLDWMLKDGDAPVYYPWHERAKEGYAMFAWYADNAEKGATEVLEDRICRHLRIDGNQDVMGSKAYAWSTSSPNEKLYSFSYYTAVRNMEPLVCPTHLLTCMSFRFNAIISDVKQRITIKSVTIKACNNIILTACSSGEQWQTIETEGEPVDLGYHLIPGYEQREGKSLTINSVSSEADMPLPLYVGDILFPPTTSTSTLITINAEQEGFNASLNGSGEPVSFHTELEINHPSGLKAGYNYVATLTVNGTDFISARVSVVDWGEGGSIIVDEDYEPGFN